MAETLSYSVNKSEMTVGFREVRGDVYPAAGSYRNGVVIRLLKVEVYSNRSSGAPDSVDWIVNPANPSTRDPSVLSLPKLKENQPEKIVKDEETWLTARSNRGASVGVHDWSFEFLERSSSPYALGIVLGGEPRPNFRLSASIESDDHNELKPTEVASTVGVSSEIESVQSSNASSVSPYIISPAVFADMTAGSRAGAVEFEPVEAVPPIADWSSILSLLNKADVATAASLLANADIPVVVETIVPLSLRAPLELAWTSDGSLWVNGLKKIDNFGAKFLPLERLATVTMRTDRFEQTVSYYVNGVFVGIAFGAEGTSAAVTCDIAPANEKDPLNVMYPSASLSSTAQELRIKATGFFGSTVIPIQLSLAKSTASVVGRLSAAMIAGQAVDKKEISLMPWLQSPLLIGGLEKDDLSDSDSNLKLDWSSSWNQIKFGDTESVPGNGTESSAESHNTGSSISSESEFIIKVGTVSIEDNKPSIEGSLLLDWLELINPEPAKLRSNFEKSGSYSFPRCELPLIACLVKHGGLISEAIAATSAMQIRNSIGNSETSSLPTPSQDMISLWKRVKQCRAILRSQRQTLKSLVLPESREKNQELVESKEEENLAESKEVMSEENSVLAIPAEYVWTQTLEIAVGSDPAIPVGGGGRSIESKSVVADNSNETVELFYWDNHRVIADFFDTNYRYLIFF